MSDKTPPEWWTQAITDSAERFRRETAGHQMTVLRDDGLYRHLRFNRPETGFNWFDLVTWPGYLAFHGGVGDGYVFTRTEDMFAFFRTFAASHGINPWYWSEKVVAGRESVKTYSEDVVQTLLKEHLAEYEESYPDLVAAYEQAKAEYDQLPYTERWPYGSQPEPEEPASPEAVREIIDAAESDGELNYEEGARGLLQELERAGVVSNTWELSLQDFNWTFLWACHGLQWGIRQYDAARAARQAEPAGRRGVWWRPSTWIRAMRRRVPA